MGRLAVDEQRFQVCCSVTQPASLTRTSKGQQNQRKHTHPHWLLVRIRKVADSKTGLIHPVQPGLQHCWSFRGYGVTGQKSCVRWSQVKAVVSTREDGKLWVGPHPLQSVSKWEEKEEDVEKKVGRMCGSRRRVRDGRLRPLSAAARQSVSVTGL